jgi:hypothetical protein
MAKHQELNINRRFGQTQPTKIYDEDCPTYDYRQSNRRFKAYRWLVERVLRHDGGILNYAGIHKALGKYANQRWTGQAVATSTHILKFQAIPCDRFVWIAGVAPPEPVQWNGAHVLGSPKVLSADLGLQPRVLA